MNPAYVEDRLVSFGRSKATRWMVLALGLGCAREAQAGVVYHEDFENGTSDWALTGTWGTTSAYYKSATYSLTDSPGGTYANDSSITATKIVPFDLTGVTAGDKPRITYWLRFTSEWPNDRLHVQLSTDGTTWPQGLMLSGFQPNWTQYELGLEAYAGGVVYLRFQLETNSSTINDGWYVDEIVFDDGKPAIAITSPDASTKWAGGTTHDITWTYDGSYGSLADSFNVYYSVNGYSFTSIASGLATDTTSYPWLIPTMDAGNVFVRVELVDTYNALLTQVTTADFPVDSTAPSAFSLSSPEDAACGSSTPTFDWGDATDDFGVSYTLSVTPSSGSPLAWNALATSEYTLSGGEALSEAGNPYTWTVSALDPVNHSSTPATRTYSVDSTPPATFALAAPADGTSTNGAGLTFSWNETTDSGCGLSHYVFYIDEFTCADSLAPGTTSIALDTTACAGIATGDHTWRVAAVDLVGNVRFCSAAPGGTGGWAFTTTGGIIVDPPSGGAGGDPSGAGGAPQGGTGGDASSASGGDGGTQAPPDNTGGNSGGTGGTTSATGGTGARGGNGVGGSSSLGASGGTAGQSSGGSQTAGGSANASGAAASSTDNAGCGCRSAPRSAASNLASLLSLLALVTTHLRRNRRSARRRAP